MGSNGEEAERKEEEVQEEGNAEMGWKMRKKYKSRRCVGKRNSWCGRAGYCQVGDRISRRGRPTGTDQMINWASGKLKRGSVGW